MNRSHVAVVAALLVLAGCGVEKDAALLTGNDDTPTAPVDARYPVTTDPMYPDSTSMCGSPYSSLEIPCRDVYNVCIVSTLSTDAKWMPESYRCTDDSPTSAWICTNRPAEEWAFYGYTADECTQV